MTPAVCPRCQAEAAISGHEARCPQCGLNVGAVLRGDLLVVPGLPPQVLCGACEAPVADGARFCAMCGRSLTTPAPPATVPPPEEPQPAEHPMVAGALGEPQPILPTGAPPGTAAPAARPRATALPSERRWDLSAPLLLFLGALALVIYRAIRPVAISPQLVDPGREVWRHTLIAQLVIPAMLGLLGTASGGKRGPIRGLSLGLGLGLLGSLLALLSHDYRLTDPSFFAGLLAVAAATLVGTGLGLTSWARENLGVLAGVAVAAYVFAVIFLVAANCTISGVAVRVKPGQVKPQPATGVEVAAYTADGQRKLYSTKTDRDGSWRFRAMGGGEYLIKCGRYQERKIARRALTGGTLPMQIVLEEGKSPSR